jgi:hypothetical protein
MPPNYYFQVVSKKGLSSARVTDLDTHQLSPDLDSNRLEKPDNLISLPCSLIEDFKKNNFAVDILVSPRRVVSMPAYS